MQIFYSNGSDTEACSYSINEAKGYGLQTVTTPLPYLEEIGINRENSIILDFDCGNIKEVVEKIKNVRKRKKINWEFPKDNYEKYLVKGKSNYKRRIFMENVKVIVKQVFRDATQGNIKRKVGSELLVDEVRAKLLVDSGYAIYLDNSGDKKKEIVETADINPVIEEKKEKAVKKTVRKNAKKQ